MRDDGTNGEILLAHEGKLYACSCAAGPAIEGMFRIDVDKGIIDLHIPDYEIDCD